MFVRVTRTHKSPRAAVKVVESRREGYKVKQIILQHIGIAQSDLEIEKLKRIAEEFIANEELKKEKESGQQSLFATDSTEQRLSKIALRKNLKQSQKENQVLLKNEVPLAANQGPNLGSLREESRVIDGIHEVLGSVYDRMGANKILEKTKDQTLLRDLVMMRIAEPCSKNKTQAILARKYESTYDLDRIYRLMDKLYPEIRKLKQMVFLATQKLNAGKITIMFYDCTTLYFESTLEDNLRKFGYSKDFRFNTTQVVLALASDEEGLPIGYELFSGNTAEVKTLIASLDEWSKLFRIDSVCFVGDRAMMSESNLKLLEEKGYSYTIAAKIRSLPKALKNEILDQKNYLAHEINNELGWIAQFSHEKRRLIVSYTHSRAKHDTKKREQILEKIRKKMTSSKDTKAFINNAAIKKFANIEPGKTTLDELKISEDALWDGLHGVITNQQVEVPAAILKQYHRLWKIEECFRVNKTNLAIRPIFHFKPERIEAHIAISYLAFAVLRHAEYQAHLTQQISPEELVQELLTVQSSILIDTETKQHYRLPSHMSHQATKIYRAFQLKRDNAPTKIIKN
jgi:transposase